MRALNLPMSKLSPRESVLAVQTADPSFFQVGTSELSIGRGMNRVMQRGCDSIDGATNQSGYFVFSLDTELAWGYFDCFRPGLFSADGQRERRSIEALLDVLDEFGVIATWGVVGHLFYAQCEQCPVCPVLHWRGKYPSFKQVYKADHALWYGADIIETLLARGTQHEIAFHGYTHEVFDENTMDEDRARLEIQEWMRVAQRYEVVPRTVIFPRNRVGHLKVLKEAGFLCYRDDERPPRLFRLGRVGWLLKGIDHLLPLSTPPVHQLPSGRGISGLVTLRPSQHFFGFNRSLERLLDSLGLHQLPTRRMIRAVRKAADEKKVAHIWAHPWEFHTDKDTEKLRYLLGYVRDEIDRGRIRSIGMADLAKIATEYGVAITSEGGTQGSVGAASSQGSGAKRKPSP